jgi:RHS repeat-associated protein
LPLIPSFGYDALGRRIEKTIDGKAIQYLYDGLDIVQEIENGVVSVNYVRTLNIDEPLARIKSDGTMRYYHRDALGSVMVLTDEDGVMKTQYKYEPYGNVTVSGDSDDNPFQYTGRENDGTGLYYYRARYYSPEMQRFVSEDPIGLRGGINKFVYTDNNSVNRKDPLGLVWYGNWCGPGGSGTPINCYDSACKRHDECYEDCGIEWLSRWTPENIGSSCAMACDKELLNNWKNCACSHGDSNS